MTTAITPWPPPCPTTALAVLVSGGLDSAILLGEAVKVYPQVVPIFVRVGSLWEETEFEYLSRFLHAIATPALSKLVQLNVPVADVYGVHWSLTGQGVPGADTPDEAVFLPGRNVLLLAKPLLWCHLNNVPELALAPLGSNPFPDSSDTFFDAMASVVNQAVNGTVKVLAPYAQMNLHKVDVLRRGQGMPLMHTFSCIQPMRGLHCGRCNKCAERQQGFSDAHLKDPTHYAT